MQQCCIQYIAYTPPAAGNQLRIVCCTVSLSFFTFFPVLSEKSLVSRNRTLHPLQYQRRVRKITYYSSSSHEFLLRSSLLILCSRIETFPTHLTSVAPLFTWNVRSFSERKLTQLILIHFTTNKEGEWQNKNSFKGRKLKLQMLGN